MKNSSKFTVASSESLPSIISANSNPSSPSSSILKNSFS